MPPPPVPGSLLWLRQRRWRVTSARADRRVVRLDVSHRSGQLTVLAPYDRPRVIAPDRRAVRVRRQQALARLACLLGARPSSRLAHAAIDARLDIWPHQIEPVLAALDGQRRLLIADDVGLGKTIQAGIVLAEVLRRTPAAHAMVITPAGLCHQWADELRHRFGIDAWTADTTLGNAAGGSPPDANPWKRPGVWILSIDYLKQPHVIGGLPHDAWDVVVVDEAHIATGRSDRHAACDELGRRARHLVLLSATPHDGDATRFSRLLRLGALPFAGDALAVFRRTRADIAFPGRRVVRWTRVRTAPDLTRLLDALQAFERVVLTGARPTAHDAALLLLSVFRKRVLSTVAALDRSLARRLEWLDSTACADRPDWRQPAFDFGADELDDEDRTWLAADVGLPRARERAWLHRLRSLAASTAAHEPKLLHLRALATRSAESFVLFTEFRHSLEAAQRMLSGVRTVAVIHGGQPDATRRREIARFLDGEASVLLATDVGSQGLNLQSRARWVVTLELPWNPTRLEQRIGRLDRLGQQRRVHATMLVTDHPMEDRLLASMARRTLSAQRDLGASTLADIAPPPHVAVASALFHGTPLQERAPVDATVRPCTTYRRHACAHAVVAMRRRRLLRRWRGGSAPGGRPVRGPVAFAGLPRRVRCVVVLSAPILDGLGDVIERRLLAVALPARIGSPARRDVPIERGLMALAALVRRRLRRLQRTATAVAVRRLATERAIALHLHTINHPGEAQLGLFSQREATVFHQARSRAAFGAAAAARHLRLEDDRARLESGEGVIEWIGDRR